MDIKEQIRNNIKYTDNSENTIFYALTHEEYVDEFGIDSHLRCEIMWCPKCGKAHYSAQFMMFKSHEVVPEEDMIWNFKEKNEKPFNFLIQNSCRDYYDKDEQKLNKGKKADVRFLNP